MTHPVPTIHLDMYSAEFRRGYDAACVLSALRQISRAVEEKNSIVLFVQVHKNSLIVVEGVIAENLFSFEFRTPPGIKTRQGDVEVWLKIQIAKGRE